MVDYRLLSSLGRKIFSSNYSPNLFFHIFHNDMSVSRTFLLRYLALNESARRIEFMPLLFFSALYLSEFQCCQKIHKWKNYQDEIIKEWLILFKFQYIFHNKLQNREILQVTPKLACSSQNRIVPVNLCYNFPTSCSQSILVFVSRVVDILQQEIIFWGNFTLTHSWRIFLINYLQCFFIVNFLQCIF